jgi:hypothetical protein
VKRSAPLLLSLIGAVALTAVFFAYLQPDFMFTLANQLWACF